MFEWNDDNEDHILRHGVQTFEAEEAVGDRRRIPFPAYGGRTGIVGRTGDGRLLVVIYERYGTLHRVVTAYDAGPREERSYRRAQR